MSKRKHPPAKPWEARIPGTPPPNRIAFPHQRPLPTAGTTTGRFGSGPNTQSWASELAHYSDRQALTSEPTFAERGVHTLWGRMVDEMDDEAALINSITKTLNLPTPDPSTNQDEPMEPYINKHRAEQRAAAGFVHPDQKSLRIWASSTLLPVIEMPLQGVAWHSPKTQEPGGSHSTPGLTLRSTRVNNYLFFAIADGVDSPVQVQFRIPMAALVTMLSRYQALSEKPGGYMMYLTEDGELRFPTSDDESVAGGLAPSDSNKG